MWNSSFPVQSLFSSFKPYIDLSRSLVESLLKALLEIDKFLGLGSGILTGLLSYFFLALQKKD